LPYINVLPGAPHPLGASLDANGVNFAVYSEHADRVEVCLFDEHGGETRAALTERSGFVWHGYLAGLRAGQRYGFRVAGPYDPARGLRFNPQVVLLDPYARAVDGVERWDAGCFAYEFGGEDADLHVRNAAALGAPRAVVVDSAFDWEDDAPPATPLHRSVIYEAHVRGLTKLHPEVPEALRGTYSGVAHPAVIRHLRELGVTAIELQPIHGFVDDKHLLERGLRNYWGYNSIAFLAPDVRYRSGAQLGSEVDEFKRMVKTLHRAGLEVILDVVYNHTAEGNHLGPTFSFKGLDNSTYYRLADDPRYYFDYTGTGNTLNVRHPQVLTLIMDSLRYWVEEMHVDGFRFDLASTLARQLHEVDKLSSFFTLIQDSPALRDVKLIAEPWDVGEGGYQVGNFPGRWAEWNGRYRDTIRALWKGDGGQVGEVGYRLTGSSDLYESNGRRPSASINFVTAHDGFTLADLVSYDHKHNEANGENNADGNDNERSWGCGAEGPTEDAGVLALRERQRRNLMATLLLSQGTPMILSGDELGRTQRGNNNAYCQDNELAWVHWPQSQQHDGMAPAFLAFTKRLAELRRTHPALRRARFFQGRPVHGTELRDLAWFNPSGEKMSDEEWTNQSTKTLSMFLAGRGIDDLDEQGRPLVDDNLLLVLDASHEDATFTLPVLEGVTEPWRLLVDTADDHAEETVEPGAATKLIGRSLKLFASRSRVVRTGGAWHTLGATYRLQLTPKFRFEDARAAVPYLAVLGITDVYTSPVLAAVHGSEHGYDVVDHGRLNPELGTEEDFRRFSDELKKHGMGLLVDWVPNHMGVGSQENAAWEDVLENGPSALGADTFDIDWERLPGTPDTVLVPVLGEQYGAALEQGQLKVVPAGGWFRLSYFDRSFPLEPRTIAPLLKAAAGKTGLAQDDAAQQELESIIAALGHLPARGERTPERRHERAREKEVVKRRLAGLAESRPEIGQALEVALAELNGTVGVPTSFDALDWLLRSQAYRLASWKVAAEEINYRRFFDVNTLAAIRMEDEAVFEHAHALLFRLMDERRIDALRLDHTDGLYDPVAYFDKLQGRFRRDVVDPKLNPDDAVRPVPILIEKILEAQERLPTSWPVDGTTGYDFAVSVLGLWVDPASEEALTSANRRFTKDERTFVQHVHDCKLATLESLASEVNVLARRLHRIAAANRRWSDFTLIALTRALRETLAAFPVYRTYLREKGGTSDDDVRIIRAAVRGARARNRTLDGSTFAFLEEVLLMRLEGSAEERRSCVSFAMRFQQLSSPVMAKAVEDTAFYRYNRLLCLNEVGGNPARFGTSLERFHAGNLERARSWPLGMVTLSTHDSKRGEDASARIAVLSEMPAEWEQAVERWARRLEPHHARGDGASRAPSPRDEYTFYQALIGAWPFGWDGAAGDERAQLASRLAGYMEKAAHEAKLETSWLQPDERYDRGLRAFIERAFADDDFMADVAGVSARVDVPGASNALAQTLVKLCSPGVPDTYQGAELWNQSLVDPDNRRAVDFGRRRQLLDDLTARQGDRGALARDLVARWSDGAIKLYVVREALRARARLGEIFRGGDYEPLDGGEHVIAFARAQGGHRAVVVAPRLTRAVAREAGGWAMGSVWGETTMEAPRGVYRDVFTGRLHHPGPRLKVADVLSEFPVALLLEEPS
jgi:isoamylase